MKSERFDFTSDDSVFLTNYSEKASYCRGRIIDTSISVEMKLAEVLSDFFNQDAIKRQFLFTSIFTNSDLSFSSKAKILTQLLAVFFPDTRNVLPDLIEDINTIIKLRVQLDHSMLDTSPEFLQLRQEDRLQFIYFNDGKRKEMVVTDHDFITAMRKAALVIIGLDRLRTELNLV